MGVFNHSTINSVPFNGRRRRAVAQVPALLPVDYRRYVGGWLDERTIPAAFIDQRRYLASWLDERAYLASFVDWRGYFGGWVDTRLIKMPVQGQTLTDQVIGNLVPGNTRQLKRTVSGLPAGVTLTTVRLMVKRNLTDLDADALINRAVTTSATAYGVITDADTNDGDCDFQVNIIPADSFLLDPDRKYHYDLKAQASDSNIAHTFEKGVIQTIRGVRIANT